MRQTYNIFNYEKRAVGIVDLEKNDESGGGSFFGSFAKLIFLIIVIGLGIFLAKYVYDKYINIDVSPWIVDIKGSKLVPSYSIFIYKNKYIYKNK